MWLSIYATESPQCLSAVSANIMDILRFGLNFQEKKVFVCLFAFQGYSISTSMMQGNA